MKIENKKSRVYRCKTLEEIAEALQGNMSFEHDIGNDIFPTHYHIHISEEDFSIVGSCGDCIQSFSSPYYGECDDDSFEWETLENRDFRNVCYDLLEQVNTYIREEMEFIDD